MGPGQALVLLLGNSGPTLARNVKVSFDPTPPSTLDIKKHVVWSDALAGSQDAHPGNLHVVAAELRETTKACKELNRIIRNAKLEPA
jgi:hypothetical protein